MNSGSPGLGQHAYLEGLLCHILLGLCDCLLGLDCLLSSRLGRQPVHKGMNATSRLQGAAAPFHTRETVPGGFNARGPPVHKTNEVCKKFLAGICASSKWRPPAAAPFHTQETVPGRFNTRSQPVSRVWNGTAAGAPQLECCATLQCDALHGRLLKQYVNLHHHQQLYH